MAKYNLQPNEAVIMKDDQVLHGGFMSTYTDELILTNLNLILLSKGTFGNIKNIQYFPLNQIKVVNGQAQVLATKKNGSPQIEVYFINGQEDFGFMKKKGAENWVNSIKQLIAGNDVNYSENENSALPGTEAIAETVKDTVDIFKAAFGFKSENENSSAPEQVVGKCNNCGASISGIKGQVTRCPYCDSDYQL